MRLSYSQKILILSSVTLVIIVILDIIFTRLLMDKIVSINDKVKQLDFSTQERERALDLKDSIISTISDREKLDKYFIGTSNAEIAAFAKYLEDLAREAGVVEKKTLEYEPVAELASSQAVSVIRFRFNISGTWSNVFTFLQMIETLPKVASLNNVTLNLNSSPTTTKEAKSAGRIWTADLDFQVVKINN